MSKYADFVAAFVKNLEDAAAIPLGPADPPEERPAPCRALGGPPSW